MSTTPMFNRYLLTFVDYIQENVDLTEDQITEINELTNNINDIKIFLSINVKPYLNDDNALERLLPRDIHINDAEVKNTIRRFVRALCQYVA